LILLVTNVDWSFISHAHLDEACELFASKFIELAKTCIPNNFFIVRPNDKPWYMSEIRLASRQRDILHNKARRNKPNLIFNGTPFLLLTITNILELHLAVKFFGTNT